jgi:N-acetylneuraminate synthase
MQCTAKYPCPIEDLNLSVISHFNSKYNIPVGLSDHSTDPVIAPVIAVAKGAIAIEKHFTLDKKLPGPDHPFALEPEELSIMVKSIRQAEEMIGSETKQILKVEEELRNFAKRSVQATSKISKGDELVEGVNFDILRPGKKSRGLEPRFLNLVNGKKAKKDFDIGDGIIE